VTAPRSGPAGAWLLALVVSAAYAGCACSAADACALLGGNDARGLGADWVFPSSPAVAAGIMVVI